MRLNVNSAARQIRCPFCSAAPGMPCRGREGESLAGTHFQRVRLSRNAIHAAMELYRPLPKGEF